MRSLVHFLENNATTSATTERDVVTTGGLNDNYSLLLTTRGRLRKKSGNRGLDLGLIESKETYELICRYQNALESDLQVDVKILIDGKLFTISSWEKIDEIKHIYRFELNASSDLATIHVLGEQLIINGPFSGNANGWNLVGDVIYDSNALLFSATGGASFGVAQQTGVPIEAGKNYRVSFDMTGTVGGIAFSIGSDFPFYAAAVQTVTFDTAYDGLNLGIIVLQCSEFDGTITNVSIKEII